RSPRAASASTSDRRVGSIAPFAADDVDGDFGLFEHDSPFCSGTKRNGACRALIVLHAAAIYGPVAGATTPFLDAHKSGRLPSFSRRKRGRTRFRAASRSTRKGPEPFSVGRNEDVKETSHARTGSVTSALHAPAPLQK